VGVGFSFFCSVFIPLIRGFGGWGGFDTPIADLQCILFSPPLSGPGPLLEVEAFFPVGRDVVTLVRQGLPSSRFLLPLFPSRASAFFHPFFFRTKELRMVTLHRRSVEPPVNFSVANSQRFSLGVHGKFLCVRPRASVAPYFHFFSSARPRTVSTSLPPSPLR